MFLAIDVGTSKAAIIAIDDGGNVVGIFSQETEADLPGPRGLAEQNAATILNVVRNLIGWVPADIRRMCLGIGISCQMHGVVAWNGKTFEPGPFVTHQDERLTLGKSSAELQEMLAHRLISNGYGLGTLAWWKTNSPEIFSTYDRFSTIGDYLVAVMSRSSDSKIDWTNAHAWGPGLFTGSSWNRNLIERLGIPFQILPGVVAPGTVSGHLSDTSFRLPPGIPILAAVGDNQASMHGSQLDEAAETVFTLGTGGQICVVLPRNAQIESGESFEVRPYFGGKKIAVGRLLTGGVGFKRLAQSAQRQLALSGDFRGLHSVYSLLIERGLNAWDARSQNPCASYFCEERFDPVAPAATTGITLSNCGEYAVDTVLGICRNFKALLPAELYSGKTGMVASGNGIRRNRLMRLAITETFGMPLRMPQQAEEAAFGTALLVKHQLPVL